jgi:hypothetical protein
LCAAVQEKKPSLSKVLHRKSFREGSRGGCKIILTSTHQGISLVAICDKNSTQTTLLFVATKKFNGSFGNVVQKEVEWLRILSDFFLKSNTIDKHDQ